MKKLLFALFLAGCECPEPVTQPRGNCIEWHDLLRNRPYPPPHGVHSYAKEVPICGNQPPAGSIHKA